MLTGQGFSNQKKKQKKTQIQSQLAHLSRSVGTTIYPQKLLFIQFNTTHNEAI